MSESGKIEFHDKRRIKSAEDTAEEEGEPDLERLPHYVEQLESQMAERDSRLKEYIAAHKEKMAEMDRVRKRLEEDVERRATARFGELLAELFPVIDALDRALEAAAATGGEDPLLEGVRLMRKGLFEVLEKQGLEMIDCSDKPFDPQIARAIAAIPVDDEEKDNLVLEQLQPGYRYGDRTLRPAMVRVGQKR